MTTENFYIDFYFQFLEEGYSQEQAKRMAEEETQKLTERLLTDNPIETGEQIEEL